MKSVFTAIKPFSSARNMFIRSYLPTARLQQNFIAYKYSPRHQNPQSVQSHKDKQSGLEDLGSINFKIESQLSKVVDSLRQNQ